MPNLGVYHELLFQHASYMQTHVNDVILLAEFGHVGHMFQEGNTVNEMMNS